MSRVTATALLVSALLFACREPDRTVDPYADPVAVDLGALPVDSGVVTFEVTIANTGTGDGEITALDLAGDDLTYVALEPALELPVAVAAGDVARVPISVTSLDALPDGWLEQALELHVTMESTWATGGCNGSAPDSETLVVPITFAVPDGCDADDDGVRSQLCGGEDCDDDDPASYPGADEICDFADNDCDGDVDNDAIDTTAWHLDADGDLFGAGPAAFACVPPSASWVDNDGDCDDTVAAVNPDATEVCNDVDDDCDSQIDDDDPSLDLSTGSRFWADRDGDTWGDPDDAVRACEAPAGYTSRARDCDDGRTFVNPDGTETCDGTLDEDCDGTVDEGGAIDATRWYADRDGDQYGDDNDSRRACTRPTGYVATPGDCDDTRPTRYPDSPESCNGVSDDCDSIIDEGAGQTWYADRDNDSYGDDTDTAVSCEPVTGYVTVGGDCNDLSYRYNPGEDDPCDDPEDYDCDGAPEDGCNSCEEVLSSGVGDTDGVYALDVDADSDGSPETSIDAYCDMTTDGGGWTLVQRTVWEWAESSQLYTGFDAWAAAAIGDPGAGGAHRLPGAVWEPLAAGGELMAVHRVRTEAGGACEPLYYTGSGGTLTVDIASRSASWAGLSAGVSLATTSLSTTDSGPSQNCVNNSAVPWFYGACCATCPTYRGSYWTDEAHPMVSYATTSADLFGRTTANACAGAPRRADNGSNFYGVDSMEFYLR